MRGYKREPSFYLMPAIAQSSPHKRSRMKGLNHTDTGREAGRAHPRRGLIREGLAGSHNPMGGFDNSSSVSPVDPKGRSTLPYFHTYEEVAVVRNNPVAPRLRRGVWGGEPGGPEPEERCEGVWTPVSERRSASKLWMGMLWRDLCRSQNAIREK